jgi:hypothetical protein
MGTEWYRPTCREHLSQLLNQCASVQLQRLLSELPVVPFEMRLTAEAGKMCVARIKPRPQRCWCMDLYGTLGSFLQFDVEKPAGFL